MSRHHRVGQSPGGASPAKLEDDFRQEEEGHYFRHNHDLLGALRARLELQDRKQAITAATGVEDDALLEQLDRYGLDTDNLQALHLLPAVAVAWADGEIQQRERELLNAAATAHGLTGSARQTFDAYLSSPPPAKLVDAAIAFCGALLEASVDPEVDGVMDTLAEITIRIADAAGGVFGVFGRVEPEEKAILEKLAQALVTDRPEAAKKLLAEL